MASITINNNKDERNPTDIGGVSLQDEYLDRMSDLDAESEACGKNAYWKKEGKQKPHPSQNQLMFSGVVRPPGKVASSVRQNLPKKTNRNAPVVRVEKKGREQVTTTRKCSHSCSSGKNCTRGSVSSIGGKKNR